MKKVIILYNFIAVSFFVLAGFVSATSVNQIIIASLFYPLFIYFAAAVFPKRKKAIVHPVKIENTKPAKNNEEKIAKLDRIEGGNLDIDRRAFLKLIGSAGGAMFIFSIFGVKKAQAAFFGSVPGPGVVALKDSSGNQIDPAEKQPTDGYNIAEVDDSTPAYYGFVNKDGAWYILKEDASGGYRYYNGSSNFSAGWSDRATHTYDYFDVVFS